MKRLVPFLGYTLLPIAALFFYLSLATTTGADDTFSLLILGTDQRRMADQKFRTDVNLLLILHPSAKKAVVLSVPRDLNFLGRKFNSLYPLFGVERVKLAFSRMLGVKADKYAIVLGFDPFVWAIEQMNGVDVNVENGFVDKSFPGDRENWGPLRLEFTKGPQHMDGERALKYVRSRKGAGAEGSDFARMRRQQNLLTSLPNAFLNNRKVLLPFAAQGLLDLITGKIQTDLGVLDVEKLYGYLEGFKDWQLQKIVLDDKNYLRVVHSKLYGGAYALVPRDASFRSLKKLIAAKLD